MSRCVCKGNWRLIVAEYNKACEDHVDGRYGVGGDFIDSDGGEWQWIGVMNGYEDFYYVVYNADREETRFLSCVGSIEGHGYAPVGTEPSLKARVTQDKLND